MGDFVQWLAALPLSLTIRRTSWIIPLMQTIHIVAIGMILSSVVMIDLRIWGLSRSQTLIQLAHRFVRWIWAAMVLLTLTGFVLVIANPRRTLPDFAFQVKMLLMFAAIPPTLILQAAMRRGGEDGNAGAGKMLCVFAAATLVLWLAVTFAGRGRWIANLMGH